MVFETVHPFLSKVGLHTLASILVSVVLSSPVGSLAPHTRWASTQRGGCSPF
jgi:hypothetical protein